MADKLTPDEIEQHLGHRVPNHSMQLLLALIAGREESAVAELEHENRLIRARNERLEKENVDLSQKVTTLRAGIQMAMVHFREYYAEQRAGAKLAAHSHAVEADFHITRAHAQTNEGERNG